MAALPAQLQDFALRLRIQFADPDARPTWAHWSDLAMLDEVVRELLEDDARIERLRAAVSQALQG